MLPSDERSTYEEAQRAFHASLESTSACFRVAELPFKRRESGYEDWYLVEDWKGELPEDLERAIIGVNNTLRKIVWEQDPPLLPPNHPAPQ